MLYYSGIFIKGFSSISNTWEPLNNFEEDEELIVEYENSLL